MAFSKKVARLHGSDRRRPCCMRRFEMKRLQPTSPAKRLGTAVEKDEPSRTLTCRGKPGDRASGGCNGTRMRKGERSNARELDVTSRRQGAAPNRVA